MENEKSTGNKYTVKDAATHRYLLRGYVRGIYGLLNPDRRFSVLLHDFQCRWRSTYPRAVLCLHVHESRQAWPCPCLQYHVSDYRRTDDGAVYDSVVFGRRHHCRTFHVRKECLP